MFIGENLATNMILGNEIFFLTEVLKYTISEAGLLMGVSAVAAVVGSFLGPWCVNRFHAGQIITGFLGLIAVGTAILMTTPWYGAIAIVLGRSIVMAARAIIIVTMFTYRQRVIPQQFLSRTVAIQRTVAYIAVPVSAMAGGYILEVTGGNMQLVIAISVGVLLLSCMVGFLSPLYTSNPQANRHPELP